MKLTPFERRLAEVPYLYDRGQARAAAQAYWRLHGRKGTARFLLLTEPSHNAKAAHTTAYKPWIHYLAPHTTAGLLPKGRVTATTLCPYSTPQCRAGCLFTAGRNQFPEAQSGKVLRTRFAWDEPQAYLSQLYWEVVTATRDPNARIRLNGTSDVRWELIPMAPMNVTRFRGDPFYDYTKFPSDVRPRTPVPGYTLVRSASERTADAELAEWLKAGETVAVVSTKPMVNLSLDFGGAEVLNGDALGEAPAIEAHPGTIITLRPKGAARKLTPGGFVR